MKKKIVLLILMTILLSNFCFSSSTDQIGIEIGKNFFKPGDSMFYIVSQLSMPDIIRAVRSKDVTRDFIVFYYKSEDIRFDITNEDNIVMGIKVVNNDVKIKGLNFRIGDSIDKVLMDWGKPDYTEGSEYCYIKRGIYIKSSMDQKIEHIYITKPDDS